ncbi:hypothetical protein J4437_04390 [Candidatus Woesearchaeota archaeon]|nr:hypothetical protein [Candidatus Woesearchaeota archaeon]
MAFLDVLMVVLIFIWDLFKEWIWAFIISFTSLQTIWIIVPIWISWFFAEFFQEKKGTSFGNAISNGVVPFWVGIDWIRQITGGLLEGGAFSFLIVGKYLVSALVMAYGLAIIIYGIRARNFIHFIGRIREVTYVLAFLTPFIYGVIEPSYSYFLSMLVFFPIFYFLIELIDKFTPEPKALSEDEGGAKSLTGDFGGLDSSLGKDLPDFPKEDSGSLSDSFGKGKKLF